MVMQITQAQYDLLTREHFLRRTHLFLNEHATHPAVRAVLANSADCSAFWRPQLADIKTMTEHALALRLAYALACRALGEKPRLSGAGEDIDVAIMMRLEAWGVVPFAAWDG